VQRRDKADQDAPGAQVYLEVLENVSTTTIKPIIAAKVKVGAQFFTDEYHIYHFTEADSPRPTMTLLPSTMAQASMLVVTRTARVFTATRWKACGPACAISWTASRVSANASCTSELHATSSCTTMGTSPGVRPSKPPCGL